MKKFIILTLLITISALTAFAQGAGEAQSRSVESQAMKRYNIFFDSGISQIDYSYHGNGDTFNKIKEDTDAALKSEREHLESFVIISGASPDGNTPYNKLLAQQRAASIRQALMQIFPDIDASLITEEFNASTWDGIKQILESDKNFPQAGQMLQIINSDMDEASKEAALRNCKEGWRYLRSNHFHSLRASTITLMVSIDEEEEKPVEETKVVEQEPVSVPETVEEPSTPEPVITEENIPEEQPEPAVSKNILMGLKTNLLYDAVAVPNIGAEFYLGNNISVVGNWMYSWWKNDPKAWYWRTYGGDLAVRYWFGKNAKENPLTGHHVGVYGQMLTYDFLIDEDGIIADKWNYAAGLEYGYSLPIAKRLNMDFTLGAGYHWGEFKEYIPLDGHYVWQATKRRQYFGPTKIEVSLVWLIGGGDKNSAKGGQR